MEKNNFYYLATDYGWQKENIGVYRNSYTYDVYFDNIIKRTHIETEEVGTFIFKKKVEKTVEDCWDTALIVELIDENKARDIITGVEFALNDSSSNKVKFTVCGPANIKYVADHFKKLNEEDIERYKERMNIFVKTIDEVNKRRAQEVNDSFEYVAQLKKKYSNQ